MLLSLLFLLQGELYLFEYFEEDRPIYEVLDLTAIVQELAEIKSVELQELCSHIRI